MNREEVYNQIEKRYSSKPEFMWKSAPEHAVFRHKENNKWYALIMKIEKTRLGLEGTGEIDVMNVKCDPEMSSVLHMTNGIYPGYHMNKEHWISILLDGSVEDGTIMNLLDISYQLTMEKGKSGNEKKKRSPRKMPEKEEA